MDKAIDKLIDEIFKPFFTMYNYEKIHGRIDSNIYYTNGMITFEFIFDSKYNELGVNVCKNDTGRFQNILECFESFMPKKYIDVFEFLKAEHKDLYNNALYFDNDSMNDHRFLLQTICFICHKYSKELEYSI